MSSTPNTPGGTVQRPFSDLPKKDQTAKMNKKAKIEANWNQPLIDCIPAHIRPRIDRKRGAKVQLGQPGVEEAWWNWSVELLRAIEELSGLTANKLEFAQEILTLEVQQRQNNPCHPQRRVAELVRNDVQLILDGLRRHTVPAIPTEIMDMAGDDGDLELGEHMGEGAEVEEDDEGMGSQDGLNGFQTGSDFYGSLNGHGKRMMFTPTPTGPVAKRRKLELQATVQELKAKAMRSRAQAARMEADALDLERQAAELRGQAGDII
ncbi:hypothetical protein M8818_000232 [Zalaria obscura]|uniref:Uncharacterized protein n=1 Tax=Zalaria obscura TaxID=2024903 RepID=A0ACC3SPH7_9PEZI